MNQLPEELLYSIALTMVPNIGAIQARILLEHFSNARNIFRASIKDLEQVPGIGTIRARSIRTYREFSLAEKEMSFLEKNRIKALLYNDNEYPKRLHHCEDPPPVLYYKGNANLNTDKVLSIVGTRRETGYGREILSEIMCKLEGYGILIISGLAYGIDAVAHRQAIKNGLPTVGVLAHGLDRLYPSLHHPLARDMLKDGGLITDFTSGVKPDKQNFPKRNRVVAGMADALLVVESGIIGGSIITVNMAAGYNREVFAVPGRVHDHKSEGCNKLIKDNNAVLTRSAEDILEHMNWTNKDFIPKAQQEIFYDLSNDEKQIIHLLMEKGNLHIEVLRQTCAMGPSAFSAALLNLEMEHLVQAYPGKIYGPVQPVS
jgi:DNA processing protein